MKVRTRATLLLLLIACFGSAQTPAADDAPAPCPVLESATERDEAYGTTDLWLQGVDEVVAGYVACGGLRLVAEHPVDAVSLFVDAPQGAAVRAYRRGGWGPWRPLPARYGGELGSEVARGFRCLPEPARAVEVWLEGPWRTSSAQVGAVDGRSFDLACPDVDAEAVHVLEPAADGWWLHRVDGRGRAAVSRLSAIVEGYEAILAAGPYGRRVAVLDRIRRADGDPPRPAAPASAYRLRMFSGGGFSDGGLSDGGFSDGGALLGWTTAGGLSSPSAFEWVDDDTLLVRYSCGTRCLRQEAYRALPIAELARRHAPVTATIEGRLDGEPGTWIAVRDERGASPGADRDDAATSEAIQEGDASSAYAFAFDPLQHRAYAGRIHAVDAASGSELEVMLDFAPEAYGGPLGTANLRGLRLTTADGRHYEARTGTLLLTGAEVAFDGSRTFRGALSATLSPTSPAPGKGAEGAPLRFSGSFRAELKWLRLPVVR